MLLTLLMVLVILVIVGSAYWNFTLLNTTAQSVSLAAQSQADRYCNNTMHLTTNPSLNPPDDCTSRARQVAGEIIRNAEQKLMFATNIQLEHNRFGPSQNNPGPTIAIPYNGIQPTPDFDGPGMVGCGNAVTQNCLPAGWGYTYAKVFTDFQPLGFNFFGNQLDGRISAGSITTTYRQPQP